MTNLKFNNTRMTTLKPNDELSNDIEITLPNKSGKLVTEEEIIDIKKYMFANDNIILHINDAPDNITCFNSLKDAMLEAIKYRTIGYKNTITISIDKDLRESPCHFDSINIGNIYITTNNIKRTWNMLSTDGVVHADESTVFTTAFILNRVIGNLIFNKFNIDIIPTSKSYQVGFILLKHSKAIFEETYIFINYVMSSVNANKGIFSAEEKGNIYMSSDSKIYIKLVEPEYVYNNLYINIFTSIAGLIIIYGGINYMPNTTNITIEEPDTLNVDNSQKINLYFMLSRNSGLIYGNGVGMCYKENINNTMPIYQYAINNADSKIFLFFAENVSNIHINYMAYFMVTTGELIQEEILTAKAFNICAVRLSKINIKFNHTATINYSMEVPVRPDFNINNGYGLMNSIKIRVTVNHGGLINLMLNRNSDVRIRYESQTDRDTHIITNIPYDNKSNSGTIQYFLE